MNNADLWQDLLSLLIGALLTAGIEWLRRIQARRDAGGKHSKHEGSEPG